MSGESTQDTGGAFAAMSDAIAHRDTGAASEKHCDTCTVPGAASELRDQGRWFHLDGTECVAGHDADTMMCAEGGGRVVTYAQHWHLRAEQAETAIERAQLALTNAIGVWQPEYVSLLDRARRGYGNEIAVGVLGDAIKVASAVLATLGQPPAEKETQDPKPCGYIRVQWDGPYRMVDRCTSPADRCARRGTHGPWEFADDEPTHLPEG